MRIDSDPTEDADPVLAIERAVQARAAEGRIDVDTASGREAIRALIEDAVHTWDDTRRRSGLPGIVGDRERLEDQVFGNLAGYGPLAALLDDDDVWEIMINAPGSIFAKRHSGRSGYHHEVFHDDAHVERILTRLLDDSSTAHRKLDPAEGLQDAVLDDGSRLHIVHPDLARGGHLIVNIRKFTGMPVGRLDQLVSRGTLARSAADLLAAAVRSRLTILVAGAPGSGKTTLLSCCTAEIDPALRVVVAEEVFEADVQAPNTASMQTRPDRPDRPGVDLRRLVAGFLRMAPDVAIVGEVRDREALPLLLTLSSGVTGYTTIHAGSARQALTRLRFLAQLSEAARHLPLPALNALVADAVDLVVHTERGPAGPVVTSVLAVEDQVSGADSVTFTCTEVFARTGGSLHWTGLHPSRVADRLERRGVDVHALLSTDGAGTLRPAGVRQREQRP